MIALEGRELHQPSGSRHWGVQDEHELLCTQVGQLVFSKIMRDVDTVSWSVQRRGMGTTGERGHASFLSYFEKKVNAVLDFESKRGTEQDGIKEDSPSCCVVTFRTMQCWMLNSGDSGPDSRQGVKAAPAAPPRFQPK